MLTEKTWTDLILPIANDYPSKLAQNNIRRSQAFSKISMIVDTLEIISARLERDVPYFKSNIYTGSDISLAHKSYAYIKSGNIAILDGKVENGFHIQFGISYNGFIKIESYRHSTVDEQTPWDTQYKNPENLNEDDIAKALADAWEKVKYTSHLYEQ